MGGYAFCKEIYSEKGRLVGEVCEIESRLDELLCDVNATSLQPLSRFKEFNYSFEFWMTSRRCLLHLRGQSRESLPSWVTLGSIIITLIFILVIVL